MEGSRRRSRSAAAAAAALAALAVAGVGRAAAPSPGFYVPGPDPAATQQIAALTAAGDHRDAALLRALEATPRAVWIDGGTPQQARVTAQTTVLRAQGRGEVPVLVLYDIPGRDCSGYSAGGATDAASYDAWIDGVATGIGNRPAIVILEPDSLGLLPQANCGSTTFTDADRFAELNYAVDTLGRGDRTSVYLDATHSGWQAVGDAAARLVQAGVQRAAGFFLNVSNYQYTQNEVFYGTWISDCIAYATQLAPGAFGACPNQYWDGGPATNWDGDALSPYRIWSDQAYSGNHSDLAWNTTGIDSRWALMLGSTKPTTHFVIDTSRNGRGPWNYSAAGYSDAGTAQDWCNPPDRGAGPRPTTATANALVDAYLWIKVPGESDGQCTRGTAGPVDPEWRLVDPPAGEWFPQQALQLAQLANPPLLP